MSAWPTIASSRTFRVALIQSPRTVLFRGFAISSIVLKYPLVRQNSYGETSVDISRMRDRQMAFFSGVPGKRIMPPGWLGNL
jgi:hypothetical protein